MTALILIQDYFPQVQRVIDAKRKRIVEVTERDCALAVAKSHTICALAIACKRFFKADGVIIQVTTAFIVKGARAIRYRLPTSIGREITSFDRGAEYDPGRYLLSRPSPKRQQKVKKLAAHKGKGEFRHHTRNIRTTIGLN